MSNHVYRPDTSNPLTRDDILFLRESDRVYARIGDDGVCTLEAIKKLDYRGQSVEITRDLVCGWDVTDYEKDSTLNPPDGQEYVYTGFIAIWHPSFRTISQHVLKTGDLLHLHWIRANGSEAADTHHVTQDQVALQITRGETKPQKLLFQLAQEIVFLDGYDACRPVRRKLRAKNYAPQYSLT